MQYYFFFFVLWSILHFHRILPRDALFLVALLPILTIIIIIMLIFTSFYAFKLVLQLFFGFAFFFFFIINLRINVYSKFLCRFSPVVQSDTSVFLFKKFNSANSYDYESHSLATKKKTIINAAINITSCLRVCNTPRQ